MKILIFGGGYADVPMILAAKKMGFHVITSGNRVDDIGHQFADEVHLEDFSDPVAMLQLAKRLQVDAICPSCNDFAAISAAFVAAELGLPGYDSYETSLLLHHKDRYRKYAASIGVFSPRAFSFASTQEALSFKSSITYPAIVKPVDLTGGKGISVIHNDAEFDFAIENAIIRSKIKKIVVEDYLDGTKHGFSALITKQKVEFYFHDDEHYFLNKYMVGAATTPGHTRQDQINRLIKDIETISRDLNLCDGILHTQYILSADEPFIIEMCRRPPGDLYTKFVQIATGMDYPEAIVSGFSGMNYGHIIRKQVHGFFARHCVMGNKKGRYLGLSVDLNIAANIINRFPLMKIDEKVGDYLSQKMEIVFLEFKSDEEMTEKMKNIHKMLQVNIL